MTFIRKIHIAVAVLLFSSAGAAYGNNIECGGSSCCSPCQSSCWGEGFISADFLYWRAFEDGLGRCIPTQVTDRVSSDGQVVSHFKGKGRNPHFRWDPGFRVGAGYELADSDWGVGAFWTHFHTHANRSENQDGDHHWKLDFDVVDVVIAYDFDWASCTHLRPFGGVRLAQIDQKQHIRNFSGSCSESVSSSFNISERHDKEDFKGIGPLLGVEADWKLGCGFSFYVSGAVSWLYGKFDIKQNESNELFDAFSSCSVRRKLDANLVAADAALGIRWQACLCNDIQLFLQLGLEHHRYFDYNRFGCYGDLSFDGANFSAAIGF